MNISSEDVYAESISVNVFSVAVSNSMQRGATVLNGKLIEKVCVDDVSPLSCFSFVSRNVDGLLSKIDNSDFYIAFKETLQFVIQSIQYFVALNFPLRGECRGVWLYLSLIHI